jgi:hypothetical protein
LREPAGLHFSVAAAHSPAGEVRCALLEEGCEQFLVVMQRILDARPRRREFLDVATGGEGLVTSPAKNDAAQRMIGRDASESLAQRATSWNRSCWACRGCSA